MSILIFLVAFLYSTIGHAGASGYILVMTFFHQNSAFIKSSALMLNFFVSLIALVNFSRQGYFSWKLFWPFALGAVPFAFIGGRLNLPFFIYKRIIGVILLYSAFRIIVEACRRNYNDETTYHPRIIIAVSVGVVLGFISGLIGVGGGIFLTPLLLLMRWARTKVAAAVSSAFILVNSVSGLIGYLQNNDFPLASLPLIPFVVVGGFLGSFIGSRSRNISVLRVIVGVVTIIAAGKLLLS